MLLILLPMELDTTEYEQGGLTKLITQKSRKKKSVSVAKTVPEDKLTTIFNDPNACDYQQKLLVEEEPSADVSNPNEERRKEVREKGKLAKMRLKEKLETGNRTVFVGNLSVKTEKKDLMKFFMKYGKIESLRFRNLMRKDLTKPLKASAIKKDLHPLSKSMNAYIIFEEEKSAIRALKRNGKNLLGSHLRVDLASSVTDREPNRKCSVFVGNMPFDAHEEDVRQHFSACGDIVNVRLIRDRETRLGKGFGYVEFKKPDSVLLALQMAEQKFGKNKLRVQRCLKHTKSENSNQKKSWAGTTFDKQTKFKSKSKNLSKGKKQKTVQGNSKIKQPISKKQTRKSSLGTAKQTSKKKQK
ncbi:RBM34 [Bugula neritina]|uniref:RBM34 n=1 Tax=Bugula neritina TaxID=10212 RepID=A0A7J7ITD2_BUGNE|nr:RBM34 [Bugula neritina]